MCSTLLTACVAKPTGSGISKSFKAAVHDVNVRDKFTPFKLDLFLFCFSQKKEKQFPVYTTTSIYVYCVVLWVELLSISLCFIYIFYYEIYAK